MYVCAEQKGKKGKLIWKRKRFINSLVQDKKSHEGGKQKVTLPASDECFSRAGIKQGQKSSRPETFILRIDAYPASMCNEKNKLLLSNSNTTAAVFP